MSFAAAALLPPEPNMGDIAEIILPVFGLIGLGYLAARSGYLSARVEEGLAQFVFTVAIPAVMFRTLATSELPSTLPWGYWLSYFGALAIVWMGCQLAARHLFHAPPKEAVIIGLSVVQANLVLAGLPLILRAFGPDAAVPIALLIAINLPITMTAASLLVESSGSGTTPAALASLARNLATHPILVALAAGLVVNTLGVKLAGPVDALVQQLAAAGPPTALFALGLALQRYGLGDRLGATLAITAVKLLLMPLLVWLLAHYVFAIPPLYANVAVLFAAMPVGVNVYLFARRYDTGVELSSSIVAVSTGLSVLTTGIWLWVLGA
jgi:malonate transporter